MKAWLFLLAFALLANITAEALAQRPRGGLAPGGGGLAPGGGGLAPGGGGLAPGAGGAGGIGLVPPAAPNQLGGRLGGLNQPQFGMVQGPGGPGMNSGFFPGGYGAMMNPGLWAINYQQAYAMWIQNQKLRTQTYFDMRRMNASYRAEEAMQHPQATPDELQQFSRSRLPTQLSSNEFDPAHGVIEWPGVLSGPEFKEDRARLEKLFSEAADDPHGSGLGTKNYRDIQDAVATMSDKLHSQIDQVTPDAYIPAQKFLKSLAYEARTPGGNALAVK